MNAQPLAGKALATPSLETMLLQAQVLLHEADEANHRGETATYSLQRQARELIAEAIDELQGGAP